MNRRGGGSIQLLFSVEHVTKCLSPGDVNSHNRSWRYGFVSCYLYMVLCSLLCVPLTSADAFNFNPCNNFLSKPVLIFSWSAWLYSFLWCDLYFLSVANYNFHLVVLNAPGIRDFQERKTNFTELKNKNQYYPFARNIQFF